MKNILNIILRNIIKAGSLGRHTVRAVLSERSRSDLRSKGESFKSKLGSIVLVASLLPLWVSSVSAMEITANQWQLVSFPRLPQNATVDSVFGEAASNGQLTAVWTFNNNSKEWQSWPAHPGLASSDLSELTLGQGYWVKTSANITLDLSDATEAVGEMVLYPGWNLIGLSIDQTMGHEQAMAGVPFLELWKYDSNQSKFQAVQKSRGSQIILKEEFTDIEAGSGLWVYMAEQSTMLPSMGTLLPPDIDIEPLLTLPKYGVQTPWDNVTPGDVDWDDDGYFDFPNTQTVVAFGDFLNRQRLSITNEGNGVLSWQATIEPAVDWLLFEAFDEDDQPVLTNFAVGNVSSTNGELVLVANRTGMAPSDNYATQIVLRANGAEQEKRIDVQLAVADVVGDYEMTVRLDDVNGKAADLHNPKYFLSFARDGQGVKAFLDEERSLLIPQITYLNGDYVADPESHFQVLGQLYLPADHEHNPYESDLRREFTIIGQRSDGKDGLSPLDLKGTYAENVYGIFADPIQLKGEFVARRLSPKPKKKDQSVSIPIQGDILAGSPGTPVSSVFDINITDRYSITDVKTALRIEHPEPEALTLKLTGPSWVNDADETVRTTVILHDKQIRSLKDVQFDDYDPAIGSLDTLDGQLSFGQWTLEIINYSTSVGNLNSWLMDISGAKVYRLTGTLPDAGVKIQISGCGIVASTITDETGAFVFDGLIPCDYELKVLQLGYEITTTDVRIIGCMQNEVCNTEAQFTQALTVEQLNELQPQLITTPGAMRVIATPFSALLPANIQAVDVTDYSSLNKTLLSRSWELFKRPDATVTNNDQLIESYSPVTLSGSWGVELNNLAAEAGSYYVKLTANVRDNSSSQTSDLVYTTDLMNIRFLNTSVIHVGAFSNFGAGGTSALKAMDMATYDLDRFPLISESGSQGTEDSDGFKPDDVEGDAYETNAPNDVSEAGVMTPTGIDAPAGDLNRHYKMYISAGQLYQGGSMYSGGVRLDVGIQSQEESE